jgi:hypothetical protein
VIISNPVRKTVILSGIFWLGRLLTIFPPYAFFKKETSMSGKSMTLFPPSTSDPPAEAFPLVKDIRLEQAEEVFTRFRIQKPYLDQS